MCKTSLLDTFCHYCPDLEELGSLSLFLSSRHNTALFFQSVSSITSRQYSVCLGSSFSMRSFAIEEAPSRTLSNPVSHCGTCDKVGQNILRTFKFREDFYSLTGIERGKRLVKKWPYATHRAKVTPPIVIKKSQCGPKVVSQFSQNCLNVVPKLSQICPKVALIRTYNVGKGKGGWVERQQCCSRGLVS